MIQVKKLYKGDDSFNRIILLSIYVHIAIVYLYINALYS